MESQNKPMHINITCKYPEEKINELLNFVYGVTKANLSKVAVNIKNCSGAFAGRAYSKVPNISNAPAGTEMLVTLRIGPHHKFMSPRSNLRKTYKWVRSSNSEYNRSKKKHDFRSCSKTVNGKTKTWMEKKEYSMQPYGGKGSPLIIVEDWMEALVSLAAHEFNHIYQFQNNLPCSEVECEKAADHALQLYRKNRP